MLDGIRRNTRSMAVKILFAVIILVFVFWGVGGFRASRRAILAKVNGEEITSKEFLEVYQREYDRILRNRPSLTAEDIRRMGLKQMIFNQLVNQRLLIQEANKLGIMITPQQLRRNITSMAIFQDKNKKFDPARYRAVLSSNDMTPLEFETLMEKDMRIQKLRKDVTQAVTIMDKEVRDLYSFVMMRGKIAYVSFMVKNFMDKAKISQGEISSYYNSHKEEFRIPEKFKLRYLKITTDVLAPLMRVSEAEIEKYYKSHKKDFFHPEMRKVSHILIRVKEGADKKAWRKAKKEILRIKEELKHGVSFSTLAKKYSQGPSASSGGDIGWIKKGETVKEFEKVAFSLKKGEVSGPVRTPFGYHLIKVEDIKKAGETPLSQVRSKIKQILAKEKANEKIEEYLDKVLDRAFSSNDLKLTAKELGLPIFSTPLLSKEEIMKQLHIKKEDINAIIAMKQGGIYENPIVVSDGYLVVQKIEDIPSKIRPLKEVRSQIEEILRAKKARELAKKKAEEFLDAIKKGAKAKGSTLPELTLTQVFRLGSGNIPGLGHNADLANALLFATPGEWLSDVYGFKDRYIIAKLVEREPFSQKEWKEQKKFWEALLLQRKRQILFNEFLKDLRSRAKIEVINKELLQD